MYALNRPFFFLSFFFFSLPLWFSSAHGVGRVSIGAKQEFTGLCASSQRAVHVAILLKVSDVRPNVCGGGGIVISFYLVLQEVAGKVTQTL